MNYALIFKLIGNMLGVEAVFLLFPLLISVIYREGDTMPFLWTILILAIFGTSLSLLKPKSKKFRTKDAFFAAALSWILFPLFGALPFYFSGNFNSFIDCIFESVSGFTTTGATILTDIESLPKGILFWRSFSHWIGGMGVLVFMLAVMPSMNASSVNLLRAESTGPSPTRILPRIRETAGVMYLIYFVMTIVVTILLCIFGLPVYDSLTHAFSIAGTGGFSIMNESMGAYQNVAVEIITSVFMFLFGISFTLYFYLFTKNYKQFFEDEELKFYLGIVLSSVILIAIDISAIYGSVFTALRHSSFQVLSIISTAGFATTDYGSWPGLSHIVLILLMLTGCCAGSTGGGIKLIRILLLFKAVKIEIGKIIHPKSVKVIMINGRRADNETVAKVTMFLFVYFVIFFISLILISLEGEDILSSATEVITMLSNVGPSLGIIGTFGNYSEFTPLSKFVFSFCMIAGRLEFFPVLILFVPSVWKRGNL